MVSNFSEMDQAILEQIVTSKNTHTLVIENLSVHLLQRALSSKPEGSIRLLATLHQRHSSTLMRATSTVTSADASLQPAIDQLVLSLANAGSVGGASAQMDVVLASRHADPAIRAIAVRDIYKAMTSWGDVEAEEVTSLRGALRSRIADTAPTVLAALYAEPNQLLTVLNEDAESYIADVAAAVHPLDTSAPRALVRAHVDFLSFHFLPSLPKNEAATNSLIRTAFEKVYFPYLLLSNPRHKTARVVWASMTDSRAEHGIGSFELVLGAADTYTWGMKDAETTEASIKKGANGKESEKDPQVKTMAKINVGVAARMAELAAVSEQRDAHTDFFLSSLSSPDSHARLLAALILRSLLSSLSGSLQITTAWRIIDVIGSESIANMSKFMGGVDSLQTFLSDESLSTTAVLKPNSGTTKDKLFAALLALIPLIPSPNGVRLDWMVESSSEVKASLSTVLYFADTQFLTEYCKCFVYPASPQALLACELSRHVATPVCQFAAGGLHRSWPQRTPLPRGHMVCGAHKYHLRKRRRAHRTCCTQSCRGVLCRSQGCAKSGRLPDGGSVSPGTASKREQDRARGCDGVSCVDQPHRSSCEAIEHLRHGRGVRNRFVFVPLFSPPLFSS
jgi:U3 small nucleolar RNA-associated protein 10